MLQEINNFMNSLPAELKQAGLKPKEGLHVLLKIRKRRELILWTNSLSAGFV